MSAGMVGTSAPYLCTSKTTCSIFPCSRVGRNPPWGCWSWLSVGGGRKQLCRQAGWGPLGKGTGATSLAHTPPPPQQDRWGLDHSRLHTHNFESDISFIFFGEVNFKRQLVIPWVLFCSNWGKHGESFGSTLHPKA